MKTLLVLLSCVTLLGCSTSPKVLDDITLVTFVGYDLVEDRDDKIEATIATPIFEAEGKIRNEFFTSEGEFGKDLEKHFMLNTPKPVGNGKLEVAIFGEAFARQGVMEATDVAQRDPSVSSNLKLAVYDGKVRDFVKQQTLQNNDLGIYVSKIIEHNMQSETIPKTNIHLFFQSFYAEGIDPFLPLIALDKGQIKLKGLALFKDDEYVTSIDEDILYRFTMLQEPVRSGNLIIKLENLEAGVSLSHIKSERKVKISGTAEAPKITFHLTLKGFINEYYGNVKGIEKQIKKVEVEIDKQLKKELETMITFFQENNVDPVGFGKKAKAHFRNWDHKKWQEVYPELDVKVIVKTNIIESGVIR
ncbi:Ger(x)C family spore germination protein [Pseudalkalibacillus sp. Hm43]|uniref:Ger(x)C family spore germination protein n=1 Tax=Pseudalkalibacillus sp. Hm43 TaxID=3450742 RepID=UPI003F421914